MSEEMRCLFAVGAMISRAWHPNAIEENAKLCWQIADAMVKAQNAEQDDGIASVVKKRRKHNSQEA
jgi:hypothetical protein